MGGTAAPVLLLFGPTASGKTAILRELFGAGGDKKPFCGAEVVSADSMQVYRGMDIGTAKPEPRERAALPHHLIDIRNPDEQFNAGDFVRLADEACAGIARRGLLPVVSGGTGFYLKNFVLGLPESPPSDPVIRKTLKDELENRGAAALMAELENLDPVSAGRIHLNDSYRLLRALEVCRASGRPLSSFAPGGGGGENPPDRRPSYRFLVLALKRDRDELYRRINERCSLMFRSGLPEEVKALSDSGFTPQDPGLRAIGYREFFVEEPGSGGPVYRPQACRLSTDLAGVEALVAQNSRRYAKRQITYCASIPGIKWIDAGEGAAEAIKKELETFLRFQ
ncbi:tRNA dimethylallyltransferase 1 [Spirochaetia bacterium]|nr:tRNA dimethylallyltransferase 1 [Spirochaetia bacterium]